MLEHIIGYPSEFPTLPNKEVINAATIEIKVRENNMKYSGTGVHIGNGLVLTAAHLFGNTSKDAEKYISNQTGLHLPVAKVSFLGDLDLAIMDIPFLPQELPAVEIASPPLENEYVTMVTHSALTDEPVTKGVVLGSFKNLSGITARFSTFLSPEEIEKDGFLFLINDTEPHPEPLDGTSGSGVYNKNGQLVGIHYASLPIFYMNGRDIFGSAVSASSNFQDLIDAYMHEPTQ